MTEQTDTPTVNTLGFSEWSSANVYDNPLESRLKFGDYLREEYIKADAYTAEIEEGFRKGFVDVLRRDKILNDDGSNFEEVQKQISELEGAPSDDSKDDSFRAQVDSGELPMARLSTGELYVGDAAADMNLVSALKISSDAGVRMQDALAAQAQLAIPDGFKEPLYKVKRIAAAQRFLEEERKQNTEFDIELDGLSTEAAQSEYSTMDWVEHKFNSIGRFGVNILSRVMGRGDAVDEAEKRRKAVDEARGIDMDQLAAKYAVKYDVRPEDMQLALEQMVLENATNKQMFEFHDADDADVGKNLRMGGYGLPTMSMQAMINKDVFDKTLAANPDLSDDVKTMLNKQRISVLKTQFVDLDKFLSKSAVSDEWNKSLVVGRSAGVDDYKILEGFVADKDNYNEFAQRAAGIGMSFINGFGQLVAALPAALGADPAKDYLASVSQANSDRRQLASVFGQEFGFFQDLGETAFPMLIDVGATALLAAGTAPAGGAGGIAYAALKAGGKSSASLTGKGIIKAITSNTLRTSSAKSVADQAEDLIAANFIKGSKEGAIDILKAYNSKLSAQLGNLPAVFIPAGTRSGAATYGAVYNQLKQNPNVTPEEAHDRALGSGLMAMTFTGSLVSGFSLIGKGGFEDALLRGLTTKQMNTVAKSVTNMVEGDLLDAAGKAIKSAMKKHAFGTAKGIGKNVVDEGIEEGIDEFVNTLITDAALDENTPMLERMQQTFHAVALGGVMGGSVPLVRRGLSRLQPDVLKQREQSMFLDQILEDASRDLTESGSPITADVFRAIISERGRRDQRRSEVPTPEEAVQLLTGDTQETDSESEKLASGITSNPEFEARLTERVNPTTTAKAISEVLAEDTPVVSGLDPSTIEAKGDMMRQLELPLAESSSNENSDHAIIRGLIAGQKESPKFNRNQFVDSATVKTQRVIDPSKKEDAEAIEAGFRQIIQEIDAAEALYKKLDRQAQAGDLSSESPAMRALQKNVNEGTAVSPEEAVDLRGDAFKKRVVELEGLKIDEEISFEELQADPEEESAVQSVIDKGFSEVIAASKLKRLGIPVNERTISDEFIAATNKKISDGISEKFPDVKVSEPQGGLTLSSTYGSGKVYLDRFGNGQFDNNPANMLGLFEQGTPIVVPESAVRSATVNPAFRFSQIGDNFFVADILIAQNGGVVSALTPFDRVATLQPDYTRTVELLERVVAFRAEGLTDPDEFIPSPFAPDARITKKDLLARLDSGLGMEQFVAPSSGELSPDFQRSALIELRLRAQDALFTNQNVSLVSLGREISDLYLQEQKDRIKYSNAAFVSTVSVTSASALQQNEEFNPSAEAEDSYTAFPESTRAFSETGIASILKEAEANAIAAIDADRPLKQTIVNLVNTEVFSSSKKDIGNTSTRKLLGLTMQWMAQGNNRANPASVEFQQALKTGNYRLGGPVREALQLMALSSASVEGSPKTNESYRATLKSKLSKIAGDRDITDSEVIAFHSQVKRSVGKLLLRSQPSGMSRAHDREVNTQAIEELGLKSNDSDSLVEAVKRIAGVSKEGGVDYDANIKAVAKLLLQSPDFLATVDLTIDDTSLEYAGDFEMLIDGTPSISINISGYNPRGVGNTLIHELIHAYVTQVTRKPQSQQSRKEAAAINNLTNLIVKLKEDFKSTSSKALEPDFIRMLDPFNPVKFDRKVYKFHDTRVYDGLANVDEFIAHFLTSTDFQKFVKSMTASSKADGNIFQKIISYIRSLIKGSNPTFDSAFSAVLDLSKSSIAETQKKFIASPRAPREPLSTKAIMGQIAESVAQEQGDSVRLASGLGAATGVTETTAIEGFENVERTIEYLRNQIVPPEVEVVVDTNSISMMSVSNDTGVMTINPIKIAAYLASLNAQNGGDPMPLRTQLNVMAVISNEEIAHAAAVKTNTTQEQDAIIESMTFADAEQAMSNYGDEGNATTREELLAGWEQGNRSSQVTIMEEYLRQHAQKVVRGFTTEEEVIFLSQNPSILQYVIRYFKRFLKRLGYYREAKNITPQLRQAVGRVVNEIRAMESGFRYQPTMMAFDANSPDALIEQFRKQVNMNKPVERPDAGSPALASGITVDESSFVEKVKSGDFNAAQTLIDGGVKMNRALFLGIDIRAGKTQNVGTTIHTALTKKEVIAKSDYEDGRGLVYGAGTGGAANDLGADSFEPFPPETFTPTYTGDRAGGRGDSIKKYPNILNTFVLNVVEPQTRDFILKDIANLLEVGGTAVIVTRGGDVAGGKDPLLKFGELEVVRKSKGELTYQKGFRKEELKAYAEQTLGDGFTVTTPTGADIQSKNRVTIIVTKDENVTLDNPPLTGGVALGTGITGQAGSFGTASNLPSEFNSEGVDYSDFVSVLELPYIEAGPFKVVRSKFKKLFVGETDPTVQRFVRQRDAFLRTSEKMVEEYHDKYKRALESDFPDKNDIPWEEIQAAVGSLDNIDPDPDFALIGKRDKAKVAASQKYQSDMAAQYKALDAAEQADITVAIATEPDPDKQKKLISKIRKETRDKKKIAKEALKLNREATAEAADNTYQQDIDTSFNAKKADAIVLRNQAFSSLREKAPSLFPILLDLRRLTDDLSKQAKRAFGKYSKKDISVKFDNNMGLYVTRRYRMFYEADYVDRILSSDRQADVEIREAAIEFMRDHYIRVETDSLMKNSAQLSLADAQKAAEDSYNKKSRGQRSLGHQMIAEFLNSYDTEQGAADFKSAFDFTDKTQTRSDKFSSRELKALTKNLEGRANIPKPLADLMGANNIPEESVDALLYTMGTVAKIGSHQTFLNSMRRYGTQGENPWLLTSAQLKQKKDDAKTDEEYQRLSTMQPIVPQGSDSPLNPLAGLYVDAEILEGLLPLFQQTVRAPEDASSQLMATLLRGAQKATGSAMALKTLGSIGFYLRNALSNVLFFGPAQGRVFSSVAALAKGDPLKGTGLSFGSAAMRAFKGTKAETSAYLRSLEALGVFGDEVRSEVMIKLMRGEESFANLQDQLEDLNNRALKSKSKKVLSDAGAMAARLGSAMDSFYKVSYFESEMATIEKAMEAEKSMPESKRTFTNMTELQRKQYAADIISATAQSYARALPVIKKFTGSSLGLVVAPFVRFTAEVPRIAVNTFTLALREIKNDNRVIKKRGYQRLGGFTSVMAFSTAIPALIAKLVSDIGEEEDEAYRMSLPPYLRNHTFYYFRTSDAPLGKFAGLVGKLAGGMKTTDGDFVTLDLTYLNPFAVIADPILRATEHIVRGEPVEAIEKAITTAFLEPYLGDQILAGSIMDVRENRNARTNKPIFEETDAVHTKLAKQLLYVGKEAYGPRTVMKAFEAVQAAGGVTEKFGDSPFGILMSEFYPVRFRQVNSTDQFRNVIFRMKSEQQRVNSRFNSLLNKGAMGEGETQRVYEDVLRSRTRINLKLRQALRGFNGFGASAKDLYGELRRAKYGDRRTKLLFTDFMENPVPSRELVNKLLQSEQGRQRLQWIMDIQQENPRFLRLGD